MNKKSMLNDHKSNQFFVIKVATRRGLSMKAYSLAFLSFWNAYPRRVSKKAAAKVFEKAISDGVTIEQILIAVDRYKKWLAGDGWRPDPKHPTTWLNQGCWEDELEIPGDVIKIAFTLEKDIVIMLCSSGLAETVIKRWFDDVSIVRGHNSGEVQSITFKKEFVRDYVARNFEGNLRRAFGVLPELIVSGSKMVAGEGFEPSASRV